VVLGRGLAVGPVMPIIVGATLASRCWARSTNGAARRRSSGQPAHRRGRPGPGEERSCCRERRRQAGEHAGHEHHDFGQAPDSGERAEAAGPDEGDVLPRTESRRGRPPPPSRQPGRPGARRRRAPGRRRPRTRGRCSPARSPTSAGQSAWPSPPGSARAGPPGASGPRPGGGRGCRRRTPPRRGRRCSRPTPWPPGGSSCT